MKKEKKDLHEYSCACNEGGKTENHIFWTMDDYADRGSPVCVFCGDDMYRV